ncbi:MAG: maleylacetate reductase [Pseudonocardiales bacterium]|nr:maleylacetate reductase [Pseudonocardiales bacterium]
MQAPEGTSLVARPGALAELTGVVDDIGARRVLVVAGGACGPIADRVIGLLGPRALGTFSDTVAHVPARSVNLAVASAQEVHADAVLTVGGGSATGFGKIIALALRVPLIAVPTTFAGAEMTSRYLVTTGEGKESGISPRVLPRMVLHDPDLTVGLPPRVIASSGMTAVASCLTALGTDSGPEVASLATTGLALLWSSLPALVRDPSDPDLLTQALRGAALAGRALERTGPGLVQLVAEELGAALGADHGAALGCLTRQSLHIEVGGGRRALQELSRTADPPDVVFGEFLQSLNLPLRLAEVCRVETPSRWVRRAAVRSGISPRAGARELSLLLESA